MQTLVYLDEKHVPERHLTPYDVYSADQAFWTTSSLRTLPVSRVNHMPMEQAPGPLFNRLIQTWSDDVGVDIKGQAMKHAKRISDAWRAGESLRPARRKVRR